MKSLRKQVFEFLDNNVSIPIKRCYSTFKDEDKKTIEQYFYQHRRQNNPNISTNDINIELVNIDTIKEMEHAIHQIRDPVKRCENLSRLHAMKLRPIKNIKQISLKEMLDGSN